MGLKDFGGISQEAAQKYGKELASRYGLMPCEAADELNNTNLSESSKNSYKPQIRQITHELGERIPDAPDVVSLISDSDKKSSTKNMMVMAMKKYYEALDEYDKSEEMVKLAKEDEDRELAFNGSMEVKEWLTVDEVDTIIDDLMPDVGEEVNKIVFGDEGYILTHEHKALFAALYYTGLRVQECVMLHVEDLYFETNEVKVYRLKKRGPDIPRDMIAVPQKFMDIISNYLKMYEIDSGEIFPFTKRTAQNRVSDINDAYKFVGGEFKHAKKLTPHKLRHSRVTAIANHSGLESAGDFVDHSSLAITNGYRHTTTGEQRKALPESDGESNSNAGEMMERLMDKYDIDRVEQLYVMLDEAAMRDSDKW